jgi:hypothetical protein
VQRYPHTARARGFLEGYAHALGRGVAGLGQAGEPSYEQEPRDDVGPAEGAPPGRLF